MFIKDVKFYVVFSKYAEKHFCKDFLKKYKTKKWSETRKTIEATLERSCAFSKTSLIDMIKFSPEKNAGIFKLDFRVAGTDVSPKGSGNRVVFHLCNITSKVTVLLVYSKNHCQKGQSETQWLLEHVKNNFPEYRGVC